MSLARIDHSSDLRKLLEEGYEVGFLGNYLLINHIPYVNSTKEVTYGIIISTLNLSGDSTLKPDDHKAYWVGDYPCDSNGSKLTKIVIEENLQMKISDNVIARFTFSQKPTTGSYENYYQKMTTYIKMIENHAHVLNPNAKAKTFSPFPLSEEESVFCYLDTATSRARITEINERLKKDKIAIVGLGGTGSYVLDLVAKTPVKEIHLFDEDDFRTHNAFRSPSAPSMDDLKKKLTKVEWLQETYSKMRRGIITHPQFIDEENVAELNSMDFVFVCIDKGKAKKSILKHLIENNKSFIDTGMDLNIQDNGLGGSVRMTTCTSSFNKHVNTRINLSDREDDEYSTNIQIADMNALNAVLAVIKWKKICGFYMDFRNEHNTSYQVSTNTFVNGDEPNETSDD